MDTRGAVPVWIHDNKEGSNPFLIRMTKDEFVIELLEKMLVKIQSSVPINRVDISNEAGGAVDVGMTVEELLASGCGSNKNPLLFNLGEGMLSYYSSYDTRQGFGKN